jgi:hypothetical protein
VKRVGLALLLLVLAGGALLGIRHARASRPAVTITYYFIPGCLTCAKTEERLRRITAPYGARVAFRSVDNTTVEGKDAKARYNFGSHGLVVEDDRSAPRIDFVEKDHRVYPEHLEGALQRLLPGGAAGHG